ncbi:MAG: folylpolyglutamate synthase/dihydrofolate synthase family protein [Verrucomicrobiota bacterium]|nr:folylpolyglutamate synthase/dihydrofolate synthase family protein [Verrucomicrobiota bacterium]
MESKSNYSPATSYSEVLRYLYALNNKGSKFGIERMRALVQALGHPESRFPIIHVAGTNGKGSVCAMLDAIYRENGYKVGFYSSPHLITLGERIQVDRKMLSKREIMHYTEQIRLVSKNLVNVSPELTPTFFEFMTAMAFLRFSSAPVDIACIETGLGGRLDATNVVNPELSIITTISLDHVELLGDTLTAIASEKAGIIKPGKPVLIGRLPREAETVIRRVAREQGCELHALTDRFPDANSIPATNLSGDFQRWNAALAVNATEILQEHFPIQSTEALMQIVWPGRWQKIRLQGRCLILDSSHNPEGVVELEKSLSILTKEERRKPIIVAGTLGENRARSLMQAVERHAREIFLVAPKQRRATPTKFLKDCLHCHAIETTISTIFPKPNCTLIGEPGDTIVITGSIYLIGEVLGRIKGVTSRECSRLQDKI